MADTAKSIEPVRLGRDTLGALDNAIARPAYNLADLSPGILHIGVGNFHRAHQAWYLHRLMQIGAARDWAIVGAGVRPADAIMRDRLAPQGYLTTLIELSASSTAAEICGAMVDFVPVQADNSALIKAMAGREIRIVSLTVTEGGYFVNPATGAFDAEHPDIRHDVENATRPCTAFGAIIAALKIRRAEGLGPFTVQSCDNLRGNGDIARDTVLGLARLLDSELADWIAQRCSFPNSMVDCIVPATGPAEIAAARRFGVEDAAPVTHENFRQWVIEDDFCAGRPDWDRVGATFTDRVHDFESMKIRMLNAGHQVLANAGELLGLDTIADCMAEPLVSAFWRQVEADEIAPHVASVPGISPQDYLELIAGRFSNPAIRDTTRRVAYDGASRHTGFVLPVLRDALAADAPIDGLCLVEALWARMCAGTRDDGSQIEPNDPSWETLSATAQLARDRPLNWLEQEDIYGTLSKNTDVAERFAHWLTLLWGQGTTATLTQFLARRS